MIPIIDPDHVTRLRIAPNSPGWDFRYGQVSAARCIGATIVDLACNPNLIEKAKAEFKERTGGGIGGSKWVAPQLPKDFEPPINYRWPEYVSTVRGQEWWIPEGA